MLQACKRPRKSCCGGALICSAFAVCRDAPRSLGAGGAASDTTPCLILEADGTRLRLCLTMVCVMLLLTIAQRLLQEGAARYA